MDKQSPNDIDTQGYQNANVYPTQPTSYQNSPIQEKDQKDVSFFGNVTSFLDRTSQNIAQNKKDRIQREHEILLAEASAPKTTQLSDSTCIDTCFGTCGGILCAALCKKLVLPLVCCGLLFGAVIIFALYLNNTQ